MEKNFLNLEQEEFDKPIFRVFSVNRLFEIFDTKELTLVRPKKWDDPFENFIMNSIGVIDDGRTFVVGSRDNFYGQCWTLLEKVMLFGESMHRIKMVYALHQLQESF